jgi:hypothetical protein
MAPCPVGVGLDDEEDAALRPDPLRERVEVLVELIEVDFDPGGEGQKTSTGRAF